MPILQWVISVPLCLFGLYVAAMNWAIFLAWYIRGRRSSMVPLVGGVCLCVGFVLIPGNPWRWLW